MLIHGEYYQKFAKLSAALALSYSAYDTRKPWGGVVIADDDIQLKKEVFGKSSKLAKKGRATFPTMGATRSTQRKILIL